MGAWALKYMGSKRYMLKNGLGHMLLEQTSSAARMVDLFCGTGSVAAFCAERTDIPVIATDLQEYAVILARSIICRTSPLQANDLILSWVERVRQRRETTSHWQTSQSIWKSANVADIVDISRTMCLNNHGIGPIWSAYGGYYFSPQQAITIDCMLELCPKTEPERSVCLSSVISAASRCAASPGHTAQPFSPTDTAGKFIVEAWKRDPLHMASSVLADICPRHALKLGDAYVADALDVAMDLTPDDLVFVDPPYSGVQYSRFYHVLETIARGTCSEVSGSGRYPPIDERPQSLFCNKSQSLAALQELMDRLADSGSRVIFTFPEGECSNGLSGDDVRQIASLRFDIHEDKVCGRFSTLGGNNGNRAARHTSCELLLLMSPK